MCNQNPCTCGSSVQVPTFNWQNIENYPCNPCTQTEVCKKFIPAKCVVYKGTSSSCNDIYGQDVQTIIQYLNNKVCDLETQLNVCCSESLSCPVPTGLTNVNID